MNTSEEKAKWVRYGERLKDGDGDGSLIGASFIIAKTAVTEMPLALAVVEAAREYRLTEEAEPMPDPVWKYNGWCELTELKASRLDAALRTWDQS